MLFSQQKNSMARHQRIAKERIPPRQELRPIPRKYLPTADSWELRAEDWNSQRCKYPPISLIIDDLPRYRLCSMPPVSRRRYHLDKRDLYIIGADRSSFLFRHTTTRRRYKRQNNNNSHRGTDPMKGYRCQKYEHSLTSLQNCRSRRSQRLPFLTKLPRLPSSAGRSGA